MHYYVWNWEKFPDVCSSFHVEKRVLVDSMAKFYCVKTNKLCLNWPRNPNEYDKFKQLAEGKYTAFKLRLP